MTFKEFAKTNNMMWISPKQAAKLMQCSIWHIYDLAKSGQVNYIKEEKNIRFKPEDLDDYERRHYVGR
jgi:excisionase family DNA binding protein